MLTVWTGLPGSGKTSGVIEKVLMPLAAKDWTEEAVDHEGNKVQVKRRLKTNINGLLLEHDKIDADELARWHEWVQPGDLIVFDEVQKPWPLTGANREQPKCITELETHRHYGIDMHLLTQHPMLINAAIVRLAGQHFHVRKVGNSRFATLYEWDGVSRTLLYKNAMAKKPWRRGKDVEAAYRSSALHTKQKRAIPTVLFIIVFCLVAFPAGAYVWGGRFTERYFGGKPLIPANTATTANPGSAKPAQPGAPITPPVGTLPAVSSVGPVSSEKTPTFAGCIALGKRCGCVDTAGQFVEKEPGFCVVNTAGLSGPPRSLDKLVIPEQTFHERQLERLADSDRELIAFANAREAETQRRSASLRRTP